VVRSLYANTPAIALCLGLTGNIGPANPPFNRFLITTQPILLGLLEAPITAMDFGLNRESRSFKLIKLLLTGKNTSCNISQKIFFKIVNDKVF